MSSTHPRVTITARGPYVVSGNVPLSVQVIVADREGYSVEWAHSEAFETQESYSLCRCGASGNKPFCDGTHAAIGFDGTLTASRIPYEQLTTVQDGPIVSLSDAEELCAFARFCDVGGQVWNLVKIPDRRAAQLAIREATLCPSGRLVARDRDTGHRHEPRFSPSIGVVEDPSRQVSGPLWVRGRIPVTAADGATYETRNRVTLCRCGASGNKPFCDGTHASIGFRDGITTVTQGERN